MAGRRCPFDKLTFTDNGTDGDGGDARKLSDRDDLPEKGEGPGSVKVTVSQPGGEDHRRGSATETSYDVSAPSTTLKLDEAKDFSGKVLTLRRNWRD